MIETSGKPEAEVFAEYLKYIHGLEVDYLECNSTNCGNNITYLLDLLKEHNIEFKSIILSQDATMQRRREAGLRKYVNEDVTIINYAVYAAFEGLCEKYTELVREANPLYASKG